MKVTVNIETCETELTDMYVAIQKLEAAAGSEIGTAHSDHLMKVSVWLAEYRNMKSYAFALEWTSAHQ